MGLLSALLLMFWMMNACLPPIYGALLLQWNLTNSYVSTLAGIAIVFLPMFQMCVNPKSKVVFTRE